ncbi:MAG: hypothetical protein IH825_03900 [Candidatus Marinimicrobia bacterium]|nr:hypothetical protein [Candidatus Neomarinimicrobiota bacterium]
MEGALVRAIGFSESVETKSDGSYELLLSIEDPDVDFVTLEFSKTGFFAQTIQNISLELGGTVMAPPSNLLPIAVTSGQVIISGFARNGVTGEPVDSAFVTVFDHVATAFSNSAGNYVLNFPVDSDDIISVTIEISKATFLPDTVSNIGISFTDTIIVRDANLLPIVSTGSKATVKGVVVDDVFFDPIEGAQIRAIGHDETTLTSELGNFSLSIAIKIDESNVLDLIFSQEDFVTDTLLNVTLTVDSTITLANQELTPANRAGPPSNATIFNVTRTSISIKGAGGEEESTELTYRLQDVNGITLDRYRPTEVSFSLFGPGGGEFLSPLVATTDADGLVRTALNSGTKAGVVQVIATFDPGTGAIISLPTPIAIHGGHPDSAHFTLTSTLNIAGLVSIREANVSAILGDKFSNIVRPGTAVQFQSKYGIIEGSDVTDENGRASVTLLSSNPLPLTSDSGFVLITGETKDENGNSIFATTLMLWSGHTLVEMVGFPGSFTIAEAGSETFTVRVADIEFGNPLEGGSTIDISASVGSISGSAIVPDTQVKGITTTLFDFTLRDDQPFEDPPAPPFPSTVTILVSSPNGNVQIQISGTID